MIRYFILILFFIPVLVNSQTDSTIAGKIPFNENFKFKDGIFLSFEDVRRNNPVPKASIITDLSYSDYAFFEKVLENKVVEVLDEMGQRQEINSKDIWGFSQNSVLFIKWNDEFNRIPVFGSLCHFIADKTYIDNRYDPFSTDYYNYPNLNNQNVQTEIRQYLLDMETGQVMDFNRNNVEIILARDKELFAQYVSFKNRKKEQLKFLYLRKYNERNPFFFIED